MAKISLPQQSRFYLLIQDLFTACSLCARPRAGLCLFDDIPKVHKVYALIGMIYLLNVLLI